MFCSSVWSFSNSHLLFPSNCHCVKCFGTSVKEDYVRIVPWLLLYSNIVTVASEPPALF
jgi:hypothetical protein